MSITSPNNIFCTLDNNTVSNKNSNCKNECNEERAHTLNQGCFCISLDETHLRSALQDHVVDDSLFLMIQERCPHVFSSHPVFISHQHAQRIQATIHAIEHVIARPQFQEKILNTAPAIAKHNPQNVLGVFYGYDFHVSEDAFGLIEINTNAGGAMFNTVLAKAQRACCTSAELLFPPGEYAAQFEQAIIAMFQHEWQLSGATQPLTSIAIVDESPQGQYLYPEFLLFQRLFQAHGIQTVIADPSEFAFIGGKLMCQGVQIELIYNRLTDFYLESATNKVLRDAYLQDAVVMSPHPRAHALYANKHHLSLLSDAAFLNSLQIDPALQTILLEGIPHTEHITPENADRLWKNRRQLFFKPTKGFGSRAAYRGDKITTKVWAEVLQNDYVAQRIVRPGERGMSKEDLDSNLKFDLRTYTYEGNVQWMTARLYQGQTTNFRTTGGGFAVVYESKESNNDDVYNAIKHCQLDAEKNDSAIIKS